jgi:hypothetical protein
MKNKLLLLCVIIAAPLATFAQAVDPNETIVGAGAKAQTGWSTFAAISATAFVFAMVMTYSRKGRK